ncbi:amidohydrolase [Clostridium fallax]|uniref:Imidazolonepropionase n=1 Tax=Clostridium fallax TaxID=1533 RepID=A0A1M4WVN7_9CLOT|nr:amidohydrolase [Clostridium fallax]SHE85299.1 Imidazolonepropionase [Clostridium fallax]SQB07432.1 amidohydrolase family protein [Clostridium fallax]
MIIKNGNIFTMAGEPLERGDILIKDGKIKEVGVDLNYEEEEIINAEGKIVIPGMIDAHCHVGIFEENMRAEGSDGNEMTNPVTPELRAIDGINPFDKSFEDAREGGITTVVTGPGSANVVGGQFVALKTYGISIDEMILKEPVAMKVAFGENPKRVYREKGKTPMTRMATAAILRETLLETLNYIEKKKVAKEKGEFFEKKLKYESLIPVIEKKIPLKAHAHRADDILTAIRIAKEFDLKITLDHCTEGHLIGEQIKRSGKDAIIGPTMTTNSKIELSNKTFKTPKELVNKGVKVAIMTDYPVIPIKYLPVCAALAMKEGLSFYESLKAITINAAEIVGIDNRVGSIEKGKDADIVILSGSPFELSTKTLYTIIDGKVVYKEA